MIRYRAQLVDPRVDRMRNAHGLALPILMPALPSRVDEWNTSPGVSSCRPRLPMKTVQSRALGGRMIPKQGSLSDHKQSFDLASVSSAKSLAVPARPPSQDLASRVRQAITVETDRAARGLSSRGEL